MYMNTVQYIDGQKDQEEHENGKMEEKLQNFLKKELDKKKELE